MTKNNMINTKTSIFILIFLSMFLVGSVGAVECNATSVEDGGIINSSSISEGCTLDKAGTYTMSGETFYINGSSSGGIIISAHNINLDGNGSILIGNWTSGTAKYGINTNSRNNTQISNIKMSKYRIAILINTASINSTIINVNINDSSEGINLQSNFSTIKNVYMNNIYGVAGITITSTAFNTSIYNNTLNNTIYGIRSNGWGSSIYDNKVINVTWWGISVENNTWYNNISRNSIINSNWDGIEILGSYNNINNNYIENTEHHPLDMLINNVGYTYSTSNIFNNNLINTTRGETLSNPFASYVYIYNSNNNLFYNNSFTGGTGGKGYGFSLKTNITIGTTNNNIFINNILNNISTAPIGLQGDINSTFINNIFTNVTASGGRPNFISFEGGSYNTTYQDSYINFTIEGLFNGTVNRTIYEYIYIRNTGEISSKIDFFGLSSSLIYNTSLYATQGSGNINITLSPNEYIYVLDNYNITEGYSRSYDPIYNGTYLNSTLTNQVTVGSSVTHYSNGYFTSGASISSSALTINPGNKAETLS